MNVNAQSKWRSLSFTACLASIRLIRYNCWGAKANSSSCLLCRLSVTVVCLYFNNARQTAVTAHFASKLLLLFALPLRSLYHYSMAEENPADQRQTAVTAYFSSNQLLVFVFVRLICIHTLWSLFWFVMMLLCVSGYWIASRDCRKSRDCVRAGTM